MYSQYDETQRIPSSFIIISLSSYSWRRQFSVESACVSLFLVFRRTGEYISLELFYRVWKIYRNVFLSLTLDPAVSASSTKRKWFLLKCCFTSTETVGLLGTGAQDVHLDFHTAPELWNDFELSEENADQKKGVYRLCMLIGWSRLPTKFGETFTVFACVLGRRMWPVYPWTSMCVPLLASDEEDFSALDNRRRAI